MMPENEKLKNIFEGFKYYLPPLSEPMAKALEALRSPQPDVRALSRLLMQDTILASKTFKLVNSSYFGARQQLTSINKALMSLGAMKVKNIIIALVLQKMYTEDGDIGLFEHSVKCATAAEYLALEYKTINPDDAFILGFLHDIGKVILKSKNSSEYFRILKDSRGDIENLLKLEEEVFGLNHSIIGAKLCQNWHLPKILINTVEYHHKPLKAKLPSAAGIVSIADAIIKDNIPSPIAPVELLDYLQIQVNDSSIIRDRVLAKSSVFLKELSDF